MSSRAGTLAPQQLSNLLKLLPDVQYAFGYGSGVFRQPNLYEAGQQPLLDFVVAVEDPAAWHAQVSPAKDLTYASHLQGPSQGDIVDVAHYSVYAFAEHPTESTALFISAMVGRRSGMWLLLNWHT